MTWHRMAPGHPRAQLEDQIHMYRGQETDCWITWSFTLGWTSSGRLQRWRLKSPRLFTQPFVQAQIKETPKLRVSGLCNGNAPVTGGFPSQRASNAENFPFDRRHRANWWIKLICFDESGICSLMKFITIVCPSSLQPFVIYPYVCLPC